MGKIKEKIDSLKIKYQIYNLENDTYRIIEQLEQLDDLGRINSLDQLNEIYAKIEHLLMLEANKTEKKINERIDKANATNDRIFGRLGIKDNTPSFAEAVKKEREKNGIPEPKPSFNLDLSFAEAVKREREKNGIPEPKPNFNPDLSFAEAVEEARKTHK